MEVEIKVQKRDKAEFIWRSKRWKGSEAENPFGRALGQWQRPKEEALARRGDAPDSAARMPFKIIL
jgi:hypothetical protein